MGETNFNEVVTIHCGKNIIGDINNHTAPPSKKSFVKMVTDDPAPPLSPYFTGREKELKKIRTYIDEARHNIIVISGMLGVGKSEICKCLFNEYEEQGEKIKRIGWLTFEKSVRHTISGKFPKIGYAEGDDERLTKTFNETKRQINAWAKSLLLFIDNMNECTAGDVNVLSSLGCKIVITTRLEEIGDFLTVSVGALSVDDCCLLYNEILERNSDDAGKVRKTVKKIVKKSGCLTFVVELLAKTAKSTSLLDNELLEELEQKGLDLSKRNKSDERLNENLAMLFDLSGFSDEETLILKQFSIFPQKSLDFKYAMEWFKQENLDVFDSLSDKGWLIETETGYYMHHVLADFIRIEYSPNYEECGNLVGRVAKSLYIHIHETVTDKLKVLPFGESLMKYFACTEAFYWASLVDGIAIIYRKLKMYEKALKLFLSALDICLKVFGEWHVITAEIYIHIGVFYCAQKKYNEALKWYLKGLEIFEIHGDKYPGTVNIYHNIASVYNGQRKYEEALELEYMVLEIKKSQFGIKNPETAQSYECIGANYFNMGQYTEALKQFYKAHEIYEETLGKEHPHTIKVYDNIQEANMNIPTQGIGAVKEAIEIQFSKEEETV